MERGLATILATDPVDDNRLKAAIAPGAPARQNRRIGLA